MHDQEHRTGSDGPNCYPALLVVKGGFALRHRVRIVEDEYCGFEANLVLATVLPVLVLVPFKAHRRRPIENIRKPPACQYNCTYTGEIKLIQLLRVVGATGLAERVGFEPTSPFLANTLSKRAPSATRTPLRGEQQL